MMRCDYCMESQRIKREAKTEAYKEFTEKLEEKLCDCHTVSDGEYCGFDREEEKVMRNHSTA